MWSMLSSDLISFICRMNGKKNKMYVSSDYSINSNFKYLCDAFFNPDAKKRL